MTRAKTDSPASESDLRALSLRIALKAGRLLESSLDHWGDEGGNPKDLVAAVGTWLDRAGRILAEKPPEPKVERTELPSLAKAREAIAAAKREAGGH